LWIGNNNSLTNISLTNLSSINGNLLINDNNTITDLDGLSNLASINGYLHFIGNYDLNNIEGIQQIDPTAINNLSIYDNDNLSQCAVESICNYLQLPAPDTDIHDNLTNCNSDAEIVAECQCDITATTSNILCNDNGTPSDATDDIFSFDLNVSGSNTGTNWSADDPNNSFGDYNTNINLGDYKISAGNLNFTIMDNDIACTTTVTVEAPASCSNQTTSHNTTGLEMLITPNGDGENDVLVFTEISSQFVLLYPDSELVVYSRWGDVVYHAKGYANNWAGDYNGVTLPDGTYYFFLQLNDGKGTALKGYILIIK